MTSSIPKLDALEGRVLGVLIEKELATPDQSPLSMNALLAGCNQVSNRNPEMMVTEPEARLTLDGLRQKLLIGIVQPAGGRVERFRQTAREDLGLKSPALAVLAELLLRGPQQPGELRTRASRMATIASQDELSIVLTKLTERGLVTQLPPAPGSRAPRYAQLLTPHTEPVVVAASASPGSASLAERVSTLEQELGRLRRNLASLAGKLGEELDG